jgi:hypothetical protein
MAYYKESFQALLRQPTSGTSIPINGRKTTLCFDLIRTRIEFTIGSVNCDTGASRIAHNKGSGRNPTFWVAEDKSPVCSPQKRCTKSESLPIGGDADVIIYAVMSEDRLIRVNTRRRVAILVFEHQPAPGPVATRRTTPLVQTGAERDDLTPHDRFFTRQMNGVEEGIDFRTLPLPRDTGSE